jgi:hypothetical protein
MSEKKADVEEEDWSSWDTEPTPDLGKDNEEFLDLLYKDALSDMRGEG